MRRTRPNKLILGPNDIFDNNGAAVAADIVVGAKVANVRNITITLKDANGVAVTSRRVVHIAMLADANGDAYAVTGGSTGLAQGADGVMLPLVAKKLFHGISKVNGSLKFTYTDTGAEAVWLAVVIGSRMIISAAL